MAKIKSISKIKSTSKKRKSPILSHKLQNTSIKKHAVRPQHTQKGGLSVREHNKALRLYQKHFKDGINIGNALDVSLEIDKKRSREELNAFYIRTMSKDIFTFTVKASGKHKVNFFRVPEDKIAKQQQVNIKWEAGEINENVSSEDVFKTAPIKFECSCGRFTYGGHRYIATKMGSVLGLHEHRYPRKTNKTLEGLLCKHLIVVMYKIHGSAFQRTFKRYIDNKRVGKTTRVTDKDKASIAGQSFLS